MDEQGAVLFQRFIQDGFGALINEEPRILTRWLRESAAETGRADAVFVSDAVEAVYGLFMEDEQGILTSFVRKLDQIARDRLPAIQKADSRLAAHLAKEFCDEVLAMVGSYNPRKKYE
jgi:hypothetical protein